RTRSRRWPVAPSPTATTATTRRWSRPPCCFEDPVPVRPDRLIALGLSASRAELLRRVKCDVPLRRPTGAGFAFVLLTTDRGTPSRPYATRTHDGVSRAVEESNRRMLRARDAMDRAYAEPLDVPSLAGIAYVSPEHFIRTFRATFGETPHRYLQRRRVERAMFLLRETGRSVTDICLAVGFTSLGTFSRTFRDIVGESPSAYRKRAVPQPAPG